MKQVGFVLIALGISLIIFVIFNLLNNNNQIASPIPEENGVKVIFVSPNPK
ncbi:MAG: hypothetical protein Q7R95_08875 [bacterium]|nr:hypothetical protein [bacterium]